MGQFEDFVVLFEEKGEISLGKALIKGSDRVDSFFRFFGVDFLG